MIEKHYFVFDKYSGSYRLRPNPDVDCGFDGGAYLGYKDNDQDSSEYDKREIFLSPDILEELAEILYAAAEEVKK